MDGLNNVVTQKNYDRKKEELVAFLHSEIAGYVQKYGTREKLSVALGFSDNHIRLIYSRDPRNLAALEKLWNECKALKNHK